MRNSLVQTIRGFDFKHGFKSQLKEYFLKLKIEKCVKGSFRHVFHHVLHHIFSHVLHHVFHQADTQYLIIQLEHVHIALFSLLLQKL